MKKLIIAILVLLLAASSSGCRATSAVDEISKISGANLSGGTTISSEDNHGGFHGDGFSLDIIDYSSSSLSDEAFENDKFWHSLPLSENLNTFVYQPYDPRVEIPAIENGYWFFYDRHSESDNPLSDEMLLGRASFNFTFAIFDTDARVLYVCRYDT